MKSYKEFIQLIKEGLIKTHNIYQYENTLNNNLIFIGFDINIDIKNKFQYLIKIFNSNLFLDNEAYGLFFSFNYNMGYYPTQFIVYRDERKNTFNFNKEKFLKEIKLSTKINIYFDAKYEDSVYKNDLKIPNLSYHLSPSKNREKIKKNGLYPKSGSRKSYHVDRIYLFYDMNDYIEYTPKRYKNNKTRFIIYR